MDANKFLSGNVGEQSCRNFRTGLSDVTEKRIVRTGNVSERELMVEDSYV